MNNKTKTMKQLKWLIDELGLNEFSAWLWATGGAALTAAIIVYLSNEGQEIFRYWRVAGLNLL